MKGKSSNNARRTMYKGVMYDSGSEARYAAVLDQQLAGKVIDGWERGKPYTMLGRIKYTPDFCVWKVTPGLGGVQCDLWWVDVKGREYRDFRLKMNMWLETGPGKLITVKEVGTSGRFKIDQEWVPGQKAPVRKRKTKKKVVVVIRPVAGRSA